MGPQPGGFPADLTLVADNGRQSVATSSRRNTRMAWAASGRLPVSSFRRFPRQPHGLCFRQIGHGQPATCHPHAPQIALRDHRRGPVTGVRHRGQRRHFLALQPDAVEEAAGRGAGGAREPGEPRAQAGLAELRQPGKLRRSIQLPDVPRSRKPSRCLPASRRMSRLARISRTWSDHQRRRHDGVWQLLSGARMASARTVVDARGRSHHRRPSRRRVERRVLAVAVRREPTCAERDARCQRPGIHHRRSGAA